MVEYCCPLASLLPLGQKTCFGELGLSKLCVPYQGIAFMLPLVARVSYQGIALAMPLVAD
jgi:hypothetical protein